MILGISGKKQSGKDLVGKIIQYLFYCDENIKTGLKHFHYPVHEWLDELDNGMVSDKYPLVTKAGWKIVKFADKVKDIVCLIIGCTREQLEDEKFKNTELGKEWDRLGEPNLLKSMAKDGKYQRDIDKLTPRKLLQLVGTDVGRVIHPNIWINATFTGYVPKGISKQHWNRTKDLYKNNLEYPNWIITDVRFPNEVKAIEDRGGIVIRVERVHPDNKWIDKEEWDFATKGIKPHPSETALDNHTFKHTIVNNSSIEDLIDKVKVILEKENLL